MKQQTFSEALATEGTEFTEKLFLSPSTRQPLLQPRAQSSQRNSSFRHRQDNPYFSRIALRWKKNARLCVLG